MKKLNKNNGITLIALVITIIVMLILVAVSISMAVNGGLFSYAGKAVGETENERDKEKDIASGKIQIDNEIYNSIDEYISKDKKEIISTDKDYVGCYADIDGDGKIDGIIYADLAFSKKGTGTDLSFSNYEYTAQSGFKEYCVSETTKGVFGEEERKEVVKATGEGNDRFYVMALEDIKVTIDETEYVYLYWYKNLNGNLDRMVEEEYNDFGEGKSNTVAMLNNWSNNASTYGIQDSRDLWGVIKNNKDYAVVENETDSGKWFVPSKAEWSAFGDYLYNGLGVTSFNSDEHGFAWNYWTSSQITSVSAYKAEFINLSGDQGCVWYEFTYGTCGVRLSATF